MSRLKGRITRLEQDAGKREKMPVDMRLVFNGDGMGDERAEKITEEYFEKNGTYEGLMIIFTNVSEPSLPPRKYRLARDLENE